MPENYSSGIGIDDEKRFVTCVEKNGIGGFLANTFDREKLIASNTAVEITVIRDERRERLEPFGLLSIKS